MSLLTMTPVRAKNLQDSYTASDHPASLNLTSNSQAVSLLRLTAFLFLQVVSVDHSLGERLRQVVSKRGLMNRLAPVPKVKHGGETH
ncbi:hypothetical protein [Pseudomonas sp. SM4]|uniref:hypothetical protein n=1 Tax=Pseudomonas sp. SM4 TaxID=3424177 RepID=UPI003F79D276